MERFRVGTSGWSYKHWMGGVFYPPEVKSARFLEYYVTRFDCTELNASFYRLPLESAVQGWLNRAPPDFRFCPKLSRWVTQMKKLKDPEEPLKLFFERMAVLEQRLGPVLIQLPPNFGFNPSRAQHFFQVLADRYAQYRYALEPRHESWFADDALELLKQYRIALVIADSGGRWPHNETITTDLTYLRFHGPDGSYASRYSIEALREYAEKIQNWLKANIQVWSFFNNDGFGFAPQNALELRELVDAQLKGRS